MSDLEAKAIGLFIVAGLGSALSLITGTSFLVYETVRRDEEPVKFWIATSIISLCAAICLAAVISEALHRR